MSNFAFCAPAPCVRPSSSSPNGRSHVCVLQSGRVAQPVPVRMSVNSPHLHNHNNHSNNDNNDNKHVMDRRSFLLAAAAAAVATVTGGDKGALAASKSSLTGDYPQDAATVLADMRTACELARGAPGMSDTVARTRKEMNDFVALYRRNQKVAGSTSFSTLYTAINTLSGHYASYGNAYPVPEKRKKRLTQQFTDIDRALNRGR